MAFPDIGVKKSWPLADVQKLLSQRPEDLNQFDANGVPVFRTNAVDETFVEKIKLFLR